MRHRLPEAVVAALAGILLISFDVAAQQQQDEQPDQQQELDVSGIEVLGDEVWMLVTSGTTTTLAGAYGILSARLAGEDFALMSRYLRENAFAVQHDLHLGGGDTAADLAGIFGVEGEKTNAFAQLLYEHRGELSQLVVPDEIDRAAAREFANIVVEGMLRDEELAESINDDTVGIVQDESS